MMNTDTCVPNDSTVIAPAGYDCAVALPVVDPSPPEVAW